MGKGKCIRYYSIHHSMENCFLDDRKASFTLFSFFSDHTNINKGILYGNILTPAIKTPP